MRGVVQQAQQVIARMPLDILLSLVLKGVDLVPGARAARLVVPLAVVVYAVHRWFQGASNTWERDMHGRVFMVTGGTSGIGVEVVRELATRGAQVVLLVRLNDQWVVDYVEDVRNACNNFMVYAEECDLASLHLVRKFATTWLDNKPPRRLDGVVCLAGDASPLGGERDASVDGLERQTAVNFAGHYHLLTLLRPALTVQPPDRDVRVVLATCHSQALGELDPADPLWRNRRYPRWQPWRVHGAAKLLLSMFATLFQAQLDEYERPDKMPNNARVVVVNPGIVRTASTRRVITVGLVFGLLVYMLLWPVFWVFFKSTTAGAQLVLYAIQAEEFKTRGGVLVLECRVVRSGREEVRNVGLMKEIREVVDKELKEVEVESARRRKVVDKDVGEKRFEELKKAVGVPKPIDGLFPATGVAPLDGLGSSVASAVSKRKKGKR